MKFFILSLVLTFAGPSFAKTDLIKVDGEKAQNLMSALYRSGIPLIQKSDGFESELIERIVCEGRREYQFSEGLLSNVTCLRDPQQNSVTLADPTSLESALSSAGAVVDAAMGKWWVYASEIKCSVDFNDLIRYRCQFLADVN